MLLVAASDVIRAVVARAQAFECASCFAAVICVLSSQIHTILGRGKNWPVTVGTKAAGGIVNAAIIAPPAPDTVMLSDAPCCAALCHALLCPSGKPGNVT